MLTLGRKVGERIIINGNISVEVLDFDRRSNRVRLGFIAPADVTIDREEVYLKKEQQRAEGRETDGERRTIGEAYGESFPDGSDEYER